MSRDARRNPLGDLGRQGLSYVLVGGGTALLEWCLFQVLYALWGVSLPIANTIATVVATVANFLLNRSATFKSTSNPVRSAIAYLVLFVVNVMLSNVIIGMLVSGGVPSTIAKLVMQGCVVCWNFVLYKKVVFV